MNHQFSSVRIQFIHLTGAFLNTESAIRREIKSRLQMLAKTRDIRITELPDDPGYLYLALNLDKRNPAFPGIPFLITRNPGNEPLSGGIFSWKVYKGFSYSDFPSAKNGHRRPLNCGSAETWLIGELLTYAASFNFAYEEDVYLNLEFSVVRSQSLAARTRSPLRKAVS